MNKALKYILLSICGGLIALCIICSYIAGCSYRKSCVCDRLAVTVLDSTVNHFISPKDIRTLLDKTYGEYLGRHADSIDLVKIEEIVQRKSAVLTNEAYMTNDGTLHIDITQRRPVVRFQKKDGGFYADEQGYIFPLQNTYASHVQIVDGNIPLAANSGYKGDIEDPKEKAWFKSVMNVVNFIEGSKTWKGKIVQISVDEKGELILVPREGNEKFLFGQPNSLAEKFGKMEKYYTTIIPEKGSERYRTVDVRFANQIVCK